jgi:hypothetical protein
MIRLLALALGALLLMGGTAAAADLPDVAWKALKERRVHIDLVDESEVTAQLLDYSEVEVVLAKDDGRIITVKRDKIKSVRASDSPKRPPPKPLSRQTEG